LDVYAPLCEIHFAKAFAGRRLQSFVYQLHAKVIMVIKNPLKRLTVISNPFRASWRFDYTQLTQMFFLLAVVLIPFDSSPFFPTSSVYRPLSALVLFVPFVLLIFKIGSITKGQGLIFLIGLLVISQSIFFSAVLFGEYSHLIKTVLTTAFFVIISVGLMHSFNTFEDDEVLLKRVANTMVIALVIIFAVGAMQLLAKFGLFPNGLQRQITGLFAYRVNNHRMQLVSGEPAMSVRHLLVFWPFIYYYYHGRYKKWILAGLIVLILLSGSTLGYLSIGLFVGIRLLLFQFQIKRILIFASALVLILIIGSYMYTSLLDPYTQRKIDAVVSIAADPESLEYILMYDGSIFVRLVNPYIGFLAADHNYFLGIGLDNYRYIYEEYVLEYFPYSMKYGAVQEAVSGEVYITPKSLYSKIICELGLIPFILFGALLVSLFMKIKKTKEERLYKFISMIFALSLALIVNNDSIIFVDFFFLLFLIIHLTRKKAQPSVQT
jgi:hypothetical protein